MEATKRCPYCAEEILADAIKCKHCGSVVKRKSVTFMQGLVVIGAAIVLVAMCSRDETPKTAYVPPVTYTPAARETAGPETASPPEAAVPMPESEASFIQLVSQAKTDSGAALNDMQRGGIKAKRDHALCALLASKQGTVSNWIGTISTIDSNSDGKGRPKHKNCRRSNSHDAQQCIIGHGSPHLD